ncbi:hypothetical protein FACS1894176_06990 [Bacteroidia bacterium]|nr:hypothetical protein FACS1894176_06990 [Bacteroidia bacterium]
MEQVKIKQLLERYWQCETSVEEERELRAFFSEQEIPEDLKQYQPLFVWENKQKNITTNQANIFTQPKKTFRIGFYPLLKIAASVLIVATFGISVYTYYQQEKMMDVLFSESASDAVEPTPNAGVVVAKAYSPVTGVEQDTLQVQNGLK